jgi:alkylated DNA repair protein alkB homolog 1
MCRFETKVTIAKDFTPPPSLFACLVWVCKVRVRDSTLKNFLAFSIDMQVNDQSSTGLSAFKRALVRYRRGSPLTLSDVDSNSIMDFSRPSEIQGVKEFRIENEVEQRTFYHGRLYGIEEYPGFLFAPQALSDGLQIQLAYLAVTEFCEKPHVTNIDNVCIKPTEEDNAHQTMWSLWKENSVRKLSRKRKPYRCFEKLTWATTGWHYDWTARTYHEGAKSPMPRILEDISRLFAETSFMVEKSLSHTFTGTASIVNYYNLKSTMGGHRDDLEFALDKPVISLSLGLPALFLLGGKSKDDNPVLPILVRPGDVMILGGESRLNYHGIVRILPSTCELQEPEFVWEGIKLPVSIDTKEIQNEDLLQLQSFLTQHRININIRQVLPDGVTSLKEVTKAKG